MQQFSEKKQTFKKEDALYRINGVNKEELIKLRQFMREREEPSFDSLKNYIRDSAAYTDLNSRILIEDDCIYFGHSLQEINASFPEINNFLYVRVTQTISPTDDSEDDYEIERNMPSFSIYMEPVITVKDRQDTTKKAATEFFSYQQNSNSLYTTESSTTTKKQLDLPENPNKPSDIFIKLVENNDVVAIGELHEDKSGKKLLIDSMPFLKKQGVKTIFLEHVLDTQEDLFQSYFDSDSLLLPPMLADYLSWLDKGFNLNQTEEFLPYTFTGLVIQAKRYGIKIVPIDTEASYSAAQKSLAFYSRKDPNDRCLMMNYIAAKKYNQHVSEKNDGSKSIFFCGSGHINAEHSGVPGIKEITNGCPTLVIEDKDECGEVMGTQDHPVKPDVLIHSTDYEFLSEEALCLQKDTNSLTQQCVKNKQIQLYSGDSYQNKFFKDFDFSNSVVVDDHANLLSWDKSFTGPINRNPI